MLPTGNFFRVVPTPSLPLLCGGLPLRTPHRSLFPHPRKDLGHIGTLLHSLMVLFHKCKVGKDDCGHGLYHDRGTEGEAHVMTARDLEGIHFAGLEIEGRLGLADA